MQMVLTAANSKATVDSLLAAEFDRVFSDEPAQAIEWAFRKWREQCNFFPTIYDIRVQIERWQRNQREKADTDSARREREAIEQARKEGKLLEFGYIVKQMREILNSQPEPEHVKREREFRLRMQRSNTEHAPENGEERGT
jgi:hypothetical protein